MVSRVLLKVFVCSLILLIAGCSVRSIEPEAKAQPDLSKLTPDKQDTTPVECKTLPMREVLVRGGCNP